MKIKAGNDANIGGDVTQGAKPLSPFWSHFTEIAWATITGLLITATVVLYLATGEIEVADIFAGLIGVAFGAFSREFVQRTALNSNID